MFLMLPLNQRMQENICICSGTISAKTKTPLQKFLQMKSWVLRLKSHINVMLQVVFYKKVHKVFFTESIPKNPSGKILRKDLRARLAAGVH